MSKTSNEFVFNRIFKSLIEKKVEKEFIFSVQFHFVAYRIRFFLLVEFLLITINRSVSIIQKLLPLELALVHDSRLILS